MSTASPESPREDRDLLVDFVPAPSRTRRHDGWTPERQRRFVAVLRATGRMSSAVAAVGKSANSAYVLRRRDDARGFAQAWDLALEEHSMRAFDLALERATAGVTVFRFHSGRYIGTSERPESLPALRALEQAERREAKARKAAKLAKMTTGNPRAKSVTFPD